MLEQYAKTSILEAFSDDTMCCDISAEQETRNSPDTFPNGINTPGILVHGVDFVRSDTLKKIFTEGLIPFACQEKPSKDKCYSINPDFVSLSLVGALGYKATATHMCWGPNEIYGCNAVSLLLDPNYVQQHREEFLAVGRYLDPDEPLTGLEQVRGMFRFEGEYGNVYHDEVFAFRVSPEAIAGMITLPTGIQRLMVDMAGIPLSRPVELFDIHNNRYGKLR